MLQQGSYTRTNGGDASKVWPEFFTDTVKDELASAREGRAIFREEERVKIHMPGNQWTKPVFKVTSEHTERWPEQYKAFKEGRELAIEGTPLEEWPILNKAQVAELKYLGIKTVEHMADLSDLTVQKIGMGGYALRERAKAFLDDAERISQNERLNKENETLRSDIAALKAQVEQMGDLMRQLHTESMERRNAQPALATLIPGMADPLAAAQQGVQQEVGSSSLDALANPPKRRGRPPRQAAA
jgi:hypothetical protein